MKSKTKQILNVLRVLSWIIFFGLCIQTGGILFTFIYSFFNPLVAQNIHLGLDLSNLYNADIGNYSAIVSCLIILSGLKGFIFYLVIKIFLTIDFQNPFTHKLVSLLARISYFSFAIWLVALIGNNFTEWLIKNVTESSELNLQNHFGGGTEFFFLGMIVFIISQVFKRGIELQSESELTI